MILTFLKMQKKNQNLIYLYIKKIERGKEQIEVNNTMNAIKEVSFFWIFVYQQLLILGVGVSQKWWQIGVLLMSNYMHLPREFLTATAALPSTIAL
jgi:hypothetical protein